MTKTTITVSILPVPATLVGSESGQEGIMRSRDASARTACRALLNGDADLAALLLSQFRGLDAL